MKNTSIKVPWIPTEFKELTDQWRSEGFAVPYNVLVGYRSEEEEIKRLLDDVAEVCPDYEPIETATACDDKRIFVAVKCKVKEERK